MRPNKAIDCKFPWNASRARKASLSELAQDFSGNRVIVDSKEVGRVADVGWALLPVSVEPVGQEWPTSSQSTFP